MDFLKFCFGVFVVMCFGVQSQGLAQTTQTTQATQITQITDKTQSEQSLNLPGRYYFEREEFSLQQVAALKKQADHFVLYRRGRLKSDLKSKFEKDCEVLPSKNIFCSFLNPKWKTEWKGYYKTENDEEEVIYQRKLPIREIQTLLNEQKFEELKGVQQYRLNKALKEFTEWKEIEPVVQTVLNEWSCPSVNISVALALKAEEFFPDIEKREIAQKLYKKAITCGKPSEKLVQLALFRGALLHIWNNDCGSAVKNLETISGLRGDFEARSIFWLRRCAIQEGDFIKASLLFRKIQIHDPINYHSILSKPKEAFELVDFAQKNDSPLVRYRSEAAPSFNMIIRMIEIFQSTKNYSTAQEFIYFARQFGGQLEPETKLYIALLAEKNGDTVSEFNLLGRIVREDPYFLTKDILKRLFPLKVFNLVNQYKKIIDPYLVMALIRQESAFNANARSPVGARGLMQLMPQTARSIARVSTQHLYNPQTNVKIGVRYFRRLLSRFDGDVELALASYNAGPEVVENWVRRYPSERRVLFLDLIPYSETRNYVSLIARNYFWYLSLYFPEIFKDGTDVLGRSLASQEKPFVFKSF